MRDSNEDANVQNYPPIRFSPRGYRFVVISCRQVRIYHSAVTRTRFINSFPKIDRRKNREKCREISFFERMENDPPTLGNVGIPATRDNR